MNRTSTIETKRLDNGDNLHIVHMYENGKLVESRELPNHNIHYANDASENWDNGIIKKEIK